MSPKEYHLYLFYNIKNELCHLPKAKLAKYKEEFKNLLNSEQKIKIYTYTTLGFKKDAFFMLWLIGSNIEDLQKFVSKLLHTKFGPYLILNYTLFGMPKTSVYSGRTHTRLGEPSPKRKKYLSIYPFTKTTDWYLLDLDKRKALMNQHMQVAQKFAHIDQLLLYSFGVDDNEFVLSYEMDTLEDFQDAVIDLRAAEVRKYTKNDLPLYLCVFSLIDEILDLI